MSRPQGRYESEQRSPAEVAESRRQIRGALRVLRPTAGAPSEPTRARPDALLSELDRWASLALLAAVEAAFRVDYVRRQARKPKDPLAKALRAVYRAKGERASLEDDILPAWRESLTDDDLRRALSDLKGSYQYRHWLAHGRYWRPNLARLYNFEDLYDLSSALLAELALLS
jgi:hypothetical protein